MAFDLEVFDTPLDEKTRRAVVDSALRSSNKSSAKKRDELGLLRTEGKPPSVRKLREQHANDVRDKSLKVGDDMLRKLQTLAVGDYFVVHMSLATRVRAMVSREYLRYGNQERARHRIGFPALDNATVEQYAIYKQSAIELNYRIEDYNRENRFETTKFSYDRADYLKVHRYNPVHTAGRAPQAYTPTPKPTYMAQPHAPASPTATQASPTATQAPIEQTVADVAELEDFDAWFSKKPKIRRAFTTGERDPNKHYTPEGWEMNADERQAQLARHRIPDDEWADPVEEY